MTKITISNNNHLGKIFAEIIGNLDLNEVFKKVGRPYAYSTQSIIKAFLIMVAYRLTSIRSLARFLKQNPEIAKVCQFQDGAVPSYRTLCRRFKCLDNWVVEWCRIILTYLIDAKILKLKILVIDGTGCESKCKKPRGDKSSMVSDPEARFGCKFNQGRKESFFGYKSMILATTEPLIVPLAWQVMPANSSEVKQLIPVVSKAAWLLKEKKKYELLGDAGFDSTRNYQWCQVINIRFTCPLNPRNRFIGQRLKRLKFYQSKYGQKLYQRRTDIERLNGHLKDLFLIDPFAVKGLKNVNTYLSLAMLLYLAGVYHNYTNGRNPRSIKSLIA